MAILTSQLLYAQEKNIIGLTDQEMATLKSQNPDFNIDISKHDESRSQYFNSITDAQNYIDSIKSVIISLTTSSERQIQLNQNSNDGKFAPCGCGDYVVSTGAAGLFSSFNISFSYCDGSVSNASINVSGLQIG